MASTTVATDQRQQFDGTPQNGVIEVSHPLIQLHLTRLRDQSTEPALFRQSVRRLAALLAYEATKDLAVRQTSVQTPLGADRRRRTRRTDRLDPNLARWSRHGRPGTRFGCLAPKYGIWAYTATKQPPNPYVTTTSFLPSDRSMWPLFSIQCLRLADQRWRR